MNPLQVALLACQIAGTVWPIVEPLAAKGLDALISDLKTKQASGKSVSLADIKAMADKHGVDMRHVLQLAEPAIAGMASHQAIDVNGAVAPGLPPGHKALSFSSFFSGIGAAFVSIRDFFASPQTAAAIVNIEHVAEAIVCGIAAGSKLALSAEQIAEAGTGTTNEIYTISALVCTALGGTPTGQTAANVTAVTSVGS